MVGGWFGDVDKVKSREELVERTLQNYSVPDGSETRRTAMFGRHTAVPANAAPVELFAENHGRPANVCAIFVNGLPESQLHPLFIDTPAHKSFGSYQPCYTSPSARRRR